MLTPRAVASAIRLVRRTSRRRPDSIWAIADQLTPEWYASSSRLHPSRSRVALSVAPIPAVVTVATPLETFGPAGTSRSYHRLAAGRVR